MKMQNQHKAQIYYHLILLILLICFIGLTEAAAQDSTTLTVVGSSSQTTTTTDTEDITFTVNVTNNNPLQPPFGVITVSTSTAVPPGVTLTPTLHPALLNLVPDTSQDVIVTCPRSSLTVAGTYTITFTAVHYFTDPDTDSQSVDLTIIVEASGVQTYGVAVEVLGSPTQTTTTAGTRDITYTLRVTNKGSGQDSFSLSHSGVTDATLSKASVQFLAPSVSEDVTLTVPRTALTSIGSYVVTVTATSDGDTSESNSATTVTIVRASSTYGLTLLNVSDLKQTTESTDDDDIVFTLRVTNIGSTEDTIAMTIVGHTIPQDKDGHIDDQITFNQESFTLAAEGTADVTVTLPRTALDTVGTYKQRIIATSQGDSTISAAVIITTTVSDGLISVRSLDTIEFEVVEDWRQATKTTDTEDITYTLRVTNTSAFTELEVDFAVSGDIAVATVTPDYADLNATPGLGNKIGEVLLTIPRDALRRAGVYTSTVEAVPVYGISKTVSVRIVVSSSGTFRVEGVGSLRQTTKPMDTEDVTYTLRVTNDSDTIDEIKLTTSGDVEAPTLEPTSVVLEAGTHKDVTLTIPRAALTDTRTYSVSITGTSDNDATITASIATQTVVTDNPSTSEQDKEPDTSEQNPLEPVTHKVVLSEFMFEVGGEENVLPLWIEIYNNTLKEINLRGLKIHWKNLVPSLSSPFELTFTIDEDYIIPAQQARLVVSALGRHSGGGRLSDDDVYVVPWLHPSTATEDEVVNLDRLNIRGGFSLQLTNAKAQLVDSIGTLTNDLQTWELPECLIEGVRSSLIRRFDDGVPRSGTERRGWIRAIDVKRLVAGLYYGHLNDLGTPGYRHGKPLPVELSQFSAKFVKNEVVINWATESELNNAGFNIFRSTSRTKNFRRINTKLIRGAGTTGERNTYQFIDKTAKSNVVYYYRIEDVDLTGNRETLTTQRLRGFITASNRAITRWSALKAE